MGKSWKNDIKDDNKILSKILDFKDKKIWIN